MCGLELRQCWIFHKLNGQQIQRSSHHRWIRLALHHYYRGSKQIKNSFGIIWACRHASYIFCGYKILFQSISTVSSCITFFALSLSPSPSLPPRILLLLPDTLYIDTLVPPQWNFISTIWYISFSKREICCCLTKAHTHHLVYTCQLLVFRRKRHRTNVSMSHFFIFDSFPLILFFSGWVENFVVLDLSAYTFPALVLLLQHCPFKPANSFV